MPSYDNIEQSFLQQIHASDLTSDDCAKLLKNLTTLNNARPTPEPPAPAEVPEKSWLDKNSGEIIKGGAAIVSVFAILIFEKGLHGIITSKATTFVPR